MKRKGEYHEPEHRDFENIGLKRSADILSASGQGPLHSFVKISVTGRFALRAQAERMSALP